MIFGRPQPTECGTQTGQCVDYCDVLNYLLGLRRGLHCSFKIIPSNVQSEELAPRQKREIACKGCYTRATLQRTFNKAIPRYTLNTSDYGFALHN